MDHRIMQFAQEARAWAEKIAPEKGHPKELGGMCALASAKLSQLLHRAEIPHRICMASERSWCHVFITHDDHIIDVTATQFAEYNDTPILVIHERLAAKNWFHTIVQTFDNHRQLRRVQRRDRWPSNQIAMLK